MSVRRDDDHPGLDRREFLRASALAGAAIGLLPLTAAPAADTPPARARHAHPRAYRPARLRHRLRLLAPLGRRSPGAPRLRPRHHLLRHGRRLPGRALRGDHRPGPPRPARSHRAGVEDEGRAGLHARGADAGPRRQPAPAADRPHRRLLQPRRERRGAAREPGVAGVRVAGEGGREDPLHRHVRPRRTPGEVPRPCHRQRSRGRRAGRIQLRAGSRVPASASRPDSTSWRCRRICPACSRRPVPRVSASSP